jgi:cell surface protein SprA
MYSPGTGELPAPALALTMPPDSTEEGDTSKVKSPNSRVGDPTHMDYVPPLHLQLPANYQTEYQLRDDSLGYDIYERVGGVEVRYPSQIGFEDYRKYRARRQNQDYLRDKSLETNEELERDLELSVDVDALSDIFGGGTITITPTGYATLNFSLDRNRTDNPALPQRQQRVTTFNFQQQIQLGVVGKIGKKLSLNVNFDTQATFDFENQVKLNHKGSEDQIVQEIGAGNVSMQLGNSLIQGRQNLQGLKTKLRFGPVYVTALASIERGQVESINVSGGGAIETPYEKEVVEYDQNRHYFLAHYFRERYEEALQDLPIVRSNLRVNRVEVWREQQGSTRNNRNIVGFVDLGENNLPIGQDSGRVFNSNLTLNPNQRFPDNGANNLFRLLEDTEAARQQNSAKSAVEALPGLRMENTADFQVVGNMRRLDQNEYDINSQLGYLSLNTPLRPDEVLFVAFNYSLNGQTYQVGEFSDDVPASGLNSNVLFTKMLKPSVLRVSPYPAWDLMMKNIYNIGYGIKSDGFFLDIKYESGTSAGKINYLPSGAIKNQPLIQVVGLDRLTNNTAPGADNYFDYVEGITIRSDKGMIIFPVLEPFGDHLANRLDNDLNEVSRYVFSPLYNLTQADAKQRFPELNRFSLEGYYRSSSSSEIPLNTFNLAEGSVTVTAGGRTLTEGSEYTVDYFGGKVTILDQSILASGQDIQVSFESSSLYNMQTKTLLGTRVEYSPHQDLALGATILNLREQPFTQKTLLGDEPINNTLWGLDATWNRESNFITKMVDRIPLISTKAPSNFSLAGEFAQFIPGAPNAIQNEEDRSVVYLDDFEAASTPFTLRGIQRWKMASFPEGNPSLYDPTNDYSNPLATNFSRGRMAWYQIDQAFYQRGFNLEFPDSDLSNNFTRQVQQSEIFPTSTPVFGANFLSTFDLRYIPQQRGMYNYQYDPGKLNRDGTFIRPEENWAGVMREIDINNDFEATNVEFLEFWLMDPFWDNPNHEGGEFYINLGLVNEDILTDETLSRENGMPTSNADNPGSLLDTTDWGAIPIGTPAADAFGNQEVDRLLQDVGLDGLNSAGEALFFASPVLDSLRGYLEPAAFQTLVTDPSSDDFLHFRDESLEAAEASILERYLNFNGTEGNSPVAQNTTFTVQATNQPDNEDLNGNGSLNFAEQYWEYRIKMDPDSLMPGQNYVVDQITTDSVLAGSDFTTPVTWYQFRIPLRSGKSVNSIQNFKTISFMRMYMTGFQEEVIMRMAEPQLVSSQWLRFTGDLSDPDVMVNPQEPPFATFELGNVSIEENSQKMPYNYVVPPGIQRQQFNGNTVAGFLEDERSLSLRACGLEDGDARGIFKNVTMDMRQYERIKMFVHAEPFNDGLLPPNFDQTGDAVAFIRLGLDNDLNYYEYEIPLTPSNGAPNDPLAIWPEQNEFDFDLAKLALAKFDRNDAGTGLIYRHAFRDETMPEGHLIYVKGTPKLSDVRNIMIGVRNPQDPGGEPICIEAWVNELRLTDFDKSTGVATNVNAQVQLADLGRVDANLSYKSAGFGPLEQQLSDRSLEDRMQYGIRAQVALDKFFPSRWGLQLPVAASYDEQRINPIFNPQEADVRTDVLIENLNPEAAKDRLESIQDFQRRRSISFLNWRKGKTQPKPGAETQKPQKQVSYPWAISNFDFSFSYNELFARDAITERRFQTQHQAGINYRYTFPQIKLKPFSWVDKIKPLTGKAKFISGFELSPLPTTFSMGVRGNRQFEERLLRSTSQFGGTVAPIYTKNFTIQRTYNLSWNLTRNLQLTFSANNDGRVDEVRGYYDDASRFARDSVGSLEENLFSLGRSRTLIPTVRPDGTRDTIVRVNDRLINMGRNIAYTHNATLGYQLPFAQIKPLNWLSGNVNYTASFQWLQAPETNPEFGGTISNQQGIQANGRVDLNGLYRKFKPLREILEEAQKKGQPERPQRPGRPAPPEEEKEEEEADSVKVSPFLLVVKRVGKEMARLLMSVRSVDLAYSQNASTTLPGYLPQTDNFGLDWRYANPLTGQTNDAIVPPTAGFIMGSQADIRGIAADNGWITRDTTLSNLFLQNQQTNLTVRTSVELIRGLRIELSANRSTSENGSEFFRFDPDSGAFRSFDPLRNGTFSMSYIFANTAFESGDPERSQVFQQFSAVRQTISQRYALENPRTANAEVVEGGYLNGYTGTNQDVLVSSLLASYGLIGPDKIELTATPKLPLPNWSINYNATQAIPFLKKHFSQFTINHTYRGTYAVGAFNNNLNFLDLDMDGYADVPDTLSIDTSGQVSLEIYNYYARDVIQAVQLTDQFAPLLGFNFTTKGGISGQIDYKRGRQLTFNVGNLQLTELKNQDFALMFGWRKDRLNWQFRLFGRDINMKNSLNTQMRMTIRDTREINHTLSPTGLPADPTLQPQTTRGALNVILSPSVDYVINKRLSAKIFFELNANRPYVANSFNTTFSSGGFQLRFTLAN